MRVEQARARGEISPGGAPPPKTELADVDVEMNEGEEESGGKEDVGGEEEETMVTVDSIIEDISDFDLGSIDAINPSAQGFSSSSAIGWLKEVRRILPFAI